MSAATFADCGVAKAKITFIHQYYDGSIFVDFSTSTNCPCSAPGRLAFNTSDPGYDFIKSMVLMAYATNSWVGANSNIPGCPIHGNTAKLNWLGLSPPGSP
jgi:hypothetical protein